MVWYFMELGQYMAILAGTWWYWITGSNNLRSFLTAYSTQNYFLIARVIFVTFAAKVPYLTFCDKMRQFLIEKTIERGEIKRK